MSRLRPTLPPSPPPLPGPPSRPELAAKPAASFREKGITLLHATAGEREGERRAPRWRKRGRHHATPTTHMPSQPPIFPFLTATGRVDILAAALAALARADAGRGPTTPLLLAPALDASAAGGATPLHLAAAGDHAAAVAALLAAGAWPDAVDARGRTPLHVAAAARAAAALAVLAPACPHIDTPTVDDVGLTALHLAAGTGCHRSVRALAAAGASATARTSRRWPPNTVDCGPGATLLHVAAARYHVAACQALLEALVSTHGGGRSGPSARGGWEADPSLDPRATMDGTGNMPYHVAWTAGAPDLSGALNPGVSIDTARERIARLPGSAGPQPLASLAAYAVRDCQIAGLVAVMAEETRREQGCVDDDDAASLSLSTLPSSSSLASTDCGVCFDPAPSPVTAPCGHALCAGCALSLTHADSRPPRCPFCRADVDTWTRDGARVWAAPLQAATANNVAACVAGCR